MSVVPSRLPVRPLVCSSLEGWSGGVPVKVELGRAAWRRTRRRDRVERGAERFSSSSCSAASEWGSALWPGEAPRVNESPGEPQSLTELPGCELGGPPTSSARRLCQASTCGAAAGGALLTAEDTPPLHSPDPPPPRPPWPTALLNLLTEVSSVRKCTNRSDGSDNLGCPRDGPAGSGRTSHRTFF